MSCLYCGGTEFSPWLTRVYDRFHYVAGAWCFVRCRGCGSAMLNPMPNAGLLSSFYPPVYTFSPELARQGSARRLLATMEYLLLFRPIYGVQAAIVSRYVSRRRVAGRKLLDIGCGRGLRLLEFRRRGFDVEGCDFTDDAVRYLREQHGIPAKTGDISRLGDIYGPASFDVISAFFVLEHVPSADQVLTACLRVLKPGGVLAAAVPLADSVQAAVFGRRWVGVTDAPRHVSLPSRSGLIRACQRAGFDPEWTTVAADATMNTAAQAGLSLSPAGATTNCYGDHRRAALMARLVAAGGMVAGLPWAICDKWLFKRPASGIVLAQKPR